MRLTVAVAVSCLVLTSLSAAQHATAAMRKETHIPPQSLDSALQTFAQDRNLQLVYATDEVGGLQTSGAAGNLTPGDALKQLLRGTGLSYQFLDDNTVTVAPTAPPARGQAGANTVIPGSTEGQGMRHLSQGTEESSAEGQGNRFWDRFRLAQAETGSSSSSTSSVGEQASLQTPVQLEEIIVTAQKKSERLQDVPVPVTAISGEALASSNQLRLQDYFTSIPGFNVIPGIQSSQVLVVRGITTGNGNPTVGIAIDDVPYGSSTQLGGSALVPDIDPGDLARVEVLRGPQGTLYGASSMGGLIKYVTVDPSTDRASGRVEAGISDVRNGDSLGYNVRASGNIPINDTLAVRLSGFSRTDPGYIDNPTTGAEGINKAKVYGGRLAALWQPREDVSLKLSALYQNSEGDGSSDVDSRPGLGALQQDYLLGTGGYDRKAQAYSAVFHAKAGAFDVTSLTGYNINHFNDVVDFSSLYGPGQALVDDNSTKKFTEEVRLSTRIGERLDWLVGAFYTHESSDYFQTLEALDPSSGATLGTELIQSAPTTYKEYAGFTNLTVHVTDRFDIQIGGRESEIRQSFEQSQSGVFAVPNPNFIPELDTKGNAFTYLLTPQLKVTPDLMLYARLASGYRAGGANTAPGGIVAPQYDPDKTQNYELGVKGDFIDHLLSVDASVYYINWKDIQVRQRNPVGGQGYTANAGHAKSQGVEVSITARPLSGLSISAWAAFNDAELTEDLPAATRLAGDSGDRLPFNARFSGNLSLQQEFPLGPHLSGFAGATMSYVGNRPGLFSSLAAPERQDYPGYAKTNLHLGAKAGAWTGNLYVNNLTDRRGELLGGIGYTPPFAFVVIQPRTVGLSLTRVF